MFVMNYCLNVICVFGFGLVANTCFAWSLFGPSNYEDCVLEGVKTAKNELALGSVYAMCGSKFPNKKASSEVYSTPTPTDKRMAAREKCGLTIEDDVRGNKWFSAEKYSKVAEILNNIRSFSIYSNYDSVSFQNGSRANIKMLVLGVLPKGVKTCSWDSNHYEAVLACGDPYENRGVGAGVFGRLSCDPEFKKFKRPIYTCQIGFIPGFGSEGFAVEADRLGLCN